MKAVIKAIEYALPEGELTNEQLAARFPEWTAERIEKKLGIRTRHIADEGESAMDLGLAAARRLFDRGACRPADVDYVLFCTQSPDYFLPTTACLVQNRLGIPSTAGALDMNLGCSGFVYGLGLAKGLVETGQCANVLLITAETYSKFIHPDDKSVRTLFGDAAAAILIGVQADASAPGGIGPFDYGTDGSGGDCLIVKAGGMRNRSGAGRKSEKHPFTDEFLYMDGGAVFNFTLRVVPGSVKAVMDKAGLTMDQVDLFVFHQANHFMLDHLRDKCGIPPEKFFVNMSDVGNTVSATIPIALKHALLEGRLTTGKRVVISGFGVGLSWSSAFIEWA
jgi:3-oxoacyl-[acyl-carrier-protein] synthase-3